MERTIEWSYRAFSDLTAIELYRILALRQKVFIVEQQCLYQDIDDSDQSSYHLMGFIKTDLVAYGRVLPPNFKYVNQASIGRVVIAPGFRGFGFGKILVRQAVELVTDKYGTVPIHISAQAHLASKFYESLGFRTVGSIYNEDGVPHVGMDLVPTEVNGGSDVTQEVNS